MTERELAAVVRSFQTALPPMAEAARNMAETFSRFGITMRQFTDRVNRAFGAPERSAVDQLADIAREEEIRAARFGDQV